MLKSTFYNIVRNRLVTFELKESVKEDTTCAGAYCLCEPIEEGVAAWPSGDSEQEPEQAKTL